MPPEPPNPSGNPTALPGTPPLPRRAGRRRFPPCPFPASHWPQRSPVPALNQSAPKLGAHGRNQTRARAMERVRPEGSGGDRGGDLGNPGGEFGGFRGTPRHSSHPPRRGSAWSSERSVWCEGGGRAARPQVPLGISKCRLEIPICSPVPSVLSRTPSVPQNPKCRPTPLSASQFPPLPRCSPRAPREPPATPSDPR